MKRNKLIVVMLLVLVAILAMGAPAALATYETQTTPNPNITIVNPVAGSVVYSNNILVSVKMTAPVSINVFVEREFVITEDGNESVSITEHLEKDSTQIYSTLVSEPNKITNANNLSFHTELVGNVEPGVYRITVETINAQGDVIHVNSNLVEIRSVEENQANMIPTDGPGSGTAQFLQNILRAIFGN